MIRPHHILAPALILLGGEDAAAGAWTRAEGEIFTSQSFHYFSTEFSASKEVDYARLFMKAYAEYGLFDWLTIGGELDQGTRMDENAKGAEEGRAGGFLRVRLGADDEIGVVSLEVGGTVPLAGWSAPAAPGGDKSEEFRMMIFYGRGFETPIGQAWVDVGAGFSKFYGKRADETRYEMTLGLRPDDKWIAMAQIFGERSHDNADFGGADFDLMKGQISLGREFMEDKTMLLSLSRGLKAWNTSKGYELSLSIWSFF